MLIAKVDNIELSILRFLKESLNLDIGFDFACTTGLYVSSGLAQLYTHAGGRFGLCSPCFFFDQLENTARFTARLSARMRGFLSIGPSISSTTCRATWIILRS